MRDGIAALGLNAAEECTIADPGRDEDDVLAIGEIIGKKDAAEIVAMALIDQLLALLLVTRPHLALHIAAQTFDPRRRKHRLGRTADSDIEIDPALWIGWRHCGRDVAVADHAQGSTDPPD